jgi:uncharacterized iron-regulated membrane protein
MIEWLTRLHRWAGLALGLVLLLVSISGTLLLLRGPYYRWQHPAFARPITAADEARTPAVLARIEAQFGGLVRTVKLPQPGMHVFHLYLNDGSEAFVDAASGAVVDRWHPRDRLPAWLFDLHAHLMAGERGEVLNGVIAALAIVFLGLGGLVMWWPRRRAMPVRAVWPRSWSAGPLLRSHAAVGVLTSIPLLVFSITGAGLALSFVFPTMARMFDAEPAPVIVSRVAPASGRAPWQAIVSSIATAFPEAGHPDARRRPQVVFLAPGRTPQSPLVARVRLPGEWHPNGRSLVVVDPYTARVLQTVDARTLGAGTRAGHLFYPVHAARIGGSASWTLTALAALAGLGLTVLSVTGVVTWWQRARAASRSRVAAATRGAVSLHADPAAVGDVER